MIVVSDTTPLNYLILIEEIELLPRLYGKVVVPAAVVNELKHVRAPSAVRAWIENPPDRLKIRDVTITEKSETSLDEGELAALALAELLHANILLIDDRKGYEEAIRRNLHPVGTLAVLAEAATQKLIDLQHVLDRLQHTTFFIAPEVLQSLMNRFKTPDH